MRKRQYISRNSSSRRLYSHFLSFFNTLLNSSVHNGFPTNLTPTHHNEGQPPPQKYGWRHWEQLLAREPFHHPTGRQRSYGAPADQAAKEYRLGNGSPP